MKRNVIAMVLAIVIIISNIPIITNAQEYTNSSLGYNYQEYMSRTTSSGITIPSETEPQNITELLKKGLTAKVFQDNVEITGDHLDHTKEIKIRYILSVPVIGDYPEPEWYVKENDFAYINLPQGLKIGSTKEITIQEDGIVLGKINFDEANRVKITFSEGIVNEEIHDVSIQFDITMIYDHDGNAGLPGDHEIIILDKNFTVTIKEPPAVLNASKNGSVNLTTGSVSWMIELHAKLENGLPTSLGGFIFEDDLSDVGTYKDGTFKVGNSSDESQAIPTTNLEVVDGTISYTFPEGAPSEQYLFFETHIPDDKFFNQGQHQIINIARVKKGDQSWDLPATVNYETKWVTKENKTDEQAIDKRYITWEITVNPQNQPMTNVIVTDQLSVDLEWLAASLEKYDGNQWVEIKKFDTNPTDGQYQIGDINETVKLIIRTRVADHVPIIGERSFENTATLDWDRPSGLLPQTATSTTTIGHMPLDKTANGYNNSQRQVNWTVSLDTKGHNYGGNLSIVEVLVHGGSNSYNSDLVTFSGGREPTEDIRAMLKSIKPSYEQEYVKDSFRGDNLQCMSYPLEQNGQVVAELLVIREVGGGEINPSQIHRMSYSTRVLNPEKYASNGNSSIVNIANLLSGQAKLIDTAATQRVSSKMMMKDMLHRNRAPQVEMNPDDLESVNSSTPRSNEAFNYVDKDILFRLHVNANGIDASNLLGQIKVEDKMPEGWELKPIAGEKFLLYEGVKKDSMGHVSAVKRILPSEYDQLVTLEENNHLIRFSFSNLDKPYVILLKGGPTEVKNQEYFSRNRTYNNLRNDGTLIAEHLKTRPNDWENFNIASTIINKKVDTSKNPDGYLTWTVDYQSYDLEKEKVEIEDIIPFGIDLRVDSNGKLIYQDNIQVRELDLQSNGTYKVGQEVVAETSVTYDAKSRVLHFIPPNKQKSYRLTYITDITGEPGLISNQVKLILNDEETKPESVKQDYRITEANASASLNRSGRFKVVMKDPEGNPLAHVELTLYNESKEEVIRSGKTNSKGEIIFKVIPLGKYILEQTLAKEGYEKNSQPHEIEVIQNADKSFTTKIDDIVLVGNTIEKINYPLSSLGELRIGNKIVGDRVDNIKKFKYTVEFDSEQLFKCTSSDVNVQEKMIKSGDVLEIAHNEELTIHGIPAGVTYEIESNPSTSEGYVVQEPSNQNGTIVAQAITDVNYNYRKKAGDLIIHNSIWEDEQTPDELNKFSFSIHLDTQETFSATYEKNNGTEEEIEVKDGSTVSLGHNESLTIHHISEGVSYSIEQDTSVSQKDYTMVRYNEKGRILDGTVQEGKFINTKIPKGSLFIINDIIGDNISEHEKMDLIVELDQEGGFSYRSNSPDLLRGELQTGDRIKLGKEEWIMIYGLPEGTSYKVEGDPSIQDKYEVLSNGAEGTILKDQTSEAQFQHKRKLLPSLRLKNQVEGDGTDQDRRFDFQINFDVEGLFKYDSTDGSGYVQSGDRIQLAHNETITIYNLPQETSYIIEQDTSTSQKDYVTLAEDEIGTISEDNVQEVLFTNLKIQKASLVITNRILGDNIDEEDYAEFILKIDQSGSFPYRSNSPQIARGSIRNGEHIKLGQEDWIMIYDLPAETKYKLEIEPTTKDKYETLSNEEEGTIVKGQTSEAQFEHRKKLIPSLKIENKVNGIGADQEKPFTFRLIFDTENLFKYESTRESGLIQNGDKIQLAHDEMLTIYDIPDGTFYLIERDELDAKEYKVQEENITGKISENVLSVAKFIHTFRSTNNDPSEPNIGDQEGDSDSNKPEVELPEDSNRPEVESLEDSNKSSVSDIENLGNISITSIDEIIELFMSDDVIDKFQMFMADDLSKLEDGSFLEDEQMREELIKQFIEQSIGQDVKLSKEQKAYVISKIQEILSSLGKADLSIAHQEQKIDENNLIALKQEQMEQSAQEINNSAKMNETPLKEIPQTGDETPLNRYILLGLFLLSALLGLMYYRRKCQDL